MRVEQAVEPVRLPAHHVQHRPEDLLGEIAAMPVQLEDVRRDEDAVVRGASPAVVHLRLALHAGDVRVELLPWPRRR